MSIIVNSRIMSTTLTGVQRYLHEIRCRLKTPHESIEPSYPLRGFRGHLWEQSYLAFKDPSKLLWSPSNCGPMFRERQILTIHDMVPIDHPEWVGKKYGAWYGMMMPKVARTVRHVVTVSEFSKQRIIETCGIPEEKVSVVLNGVDERFFVGGPSSALSELNLPFERYVLALGSLEPRKNLENLLRAWQSIEQKYAGEVGLVVAGGKGASQVFGSFNLKEQPRYIHFTGHVKDELLPALYQNALVFCYTSQYEGFGLPIAEAMASGVACVGSSVTSIPEVVGDAGLLVHPNDIGQLAEAICYLIDDRSAAAEYGKLGRDRAKRFDWNIAARRMDSLFEEWQ